MQARGWTVVRVDGSGRVVLCPYGWCGSYRAAHAEAKRRNGTTRPTGRPPRKYDPACTTWEVRCLDATPLVGRSFRNLSTGCVYTVMAPSPWHREKWRRGAVRCRVVGGTAEAKVRHWWMDASRFWDDSKFAALA